MPLQLFKISFISFCLVGLSVFTIIDKANSHHVSGAGPHCSYGINFYFTPSQNFRIAEYGILSRMKPPHSVENPGDLLEAYARIDRFATKCVLEESFLRGFPVIGAARSVAGDRRGLSDCQLDIDRQTGWVPNDMGIYQPIVHNNVIDIGAERHTIEIFSNTDSVEVRWFSSRSGNQTPDNLILEKLAQYCSTVGDDREFFINQVALDDWLGRQTTCIDLNRLSGFSRVYRMSCGKVRETLLSRRVSSVRDVTPNRQLPTNPPNFGISLEENVDRPGMDYGRIFLNTNDGPDACKWLCENDNKCRSFTFVRQGFQGSRPICYVKSGVPNKVAPRPCCVSGKKSITLNNQNNPSGSSATRPQKKAEDRLPTNLNNRPKIRNNRVPNSGQSQRMTVEQNSDRPGNDYSKITMSGNSRPEMCSSICEQDRRCKSFTFVKKGYQGNTPVCYLKGSVPRLIKNKACCVSGVKR